jgi:chemotaxis protein CheX
MNPAANRLLQRKVGELGNLPAMPSVLHSLGECLSQSPSDGNMEPSWKTLLECAAQEVLEMMAGLRLELGPSPTEEPKGEQTAMVGMAGALCGMTTLQCSRAASTKLASLMLGGDDPPNPSTAKDALGESCNMIAGNFKAKISNLGDHCMLSVPTVITGEDYSMSTTDPSEGVTVALRFDNEQIWVSLIIHS